MLQNEIKKHKLREINMLETEWVNPVNPGRDTEDTGVFLHLNVPLNHVSLNQTLGWGQHVLTHTHTHWGCAAGHRTDTAGRWRLELAHQHEHTPPTQGSGAGLWSERNEWGQRVEGNSCVRLLGWILLPKQALNTLYLSLGSFNDYYDCKLMHYILTDRP